MRRETAEKILNKVMGWKTTTDMKNEHPDLQALAKSGYDDYKQFRPGMRFIESLTSWLNQFPQEKRNAALKFVKDRLLFITEEQMEQMVSIAYPHHVIPILVEQIANENSGRFNQWDAKKIFESDEFKILHNQCLFAGLSDGSHIDHFRRSSKMIDHEQISRTHEINQARADKIKEKLIQRLKTHADKNPKPYFRNVFLIDDFSASGASYLRKYNANKPAGKIAAFFNSITDDNDPVSKLVSRDDLRLFLILYVATERTINTIQKIADMEFGPLSFTVIPIHILPDSIKFDERRESGFFELVKEERFGYEKLLDEHIARGGTEKPYLGFAQCALPLILYHNTPNNSLPILHRADDKTTFRGLFPRTSRHQ